MVSSKTSGLSSPAPPAAIESLAAELLAGHIDVVTFTSSSTVREFCAGLGEKAAELLARSLVAGHGFVYDAEVKTGPVDPFGRAPGYPVFLALVGGGSGVVV